MSSRRGTRANPLIKTSGWVKPGLLLRVILLASGVTLTEAFAYIGAFHALEAPLTYVQALFVTSSQTATGLVGITPGAVGFQEVAGVYFSTHLGLSAVVGLAALAMVRVVRVAAAVVVGVPSVLFMMRGQNAALAPARS